MTALVDADFMPEEGEISPPMGRRFDLGRVLSKFGLVSVYLAFLYAHIAILRSEGFRLSLALLVAFETIMIGYVVTRRDSNDVDFTPVAVVAGLAGSFMALGFRPPSGADDAVLGQVIQVAGLLLQLGASASLGRSFGLLPANRGIKSSGMYRIVRHPLYFSYLVTSIGYLLNNLSVRNLCVLAVGTGFQAIRIRYEERLLSSDPEYRTYVQSVRYRLLPGLW